MTARALGHRPGGIPVTRVAKSKDEYVPLTPEQQERFKGTTVKKDNKGYYCHTHRARSKSHPSVDAIPDKEISFIESTGVLKTADADSDGVMVALVPDVEASKALMAASGATEPLEEQHLTLLYLGSTEEAGGPGGRERLHRAVYDFAIHSGHDVLHGTANGWGTFYNPTDDGGGVLIALWDIPGIAEFRAALRQSCVDHGVPMREENHGFTPHQTMAYQEAPYTTLPAPVMPQPTSTFTHVVIAWGGEWQSVALSGSLAATAAARRGEHEMRAAGDWYGHFMPAGKYPEGDPRNEPEYEAKMAAKTALSDRFVNPSDDDLDKGLGGTTDLLHDRLKDPQTGADNLWSPERRKVHDEILAAVAKRASQVPHEGKCIVMAGPPGAGKSTFLRNHGEALGIKGGDRPTNFVVLNPDDFKEDLPVEMNRYPGLEPNEVATLKHEESSMLSKQAVRMLMSKGCNVILDVTLGNADKAIKQYVEPYAHRYTYQVALVDGDMRNSRNNIGLRWKAVHKETGQRTWSGRFIPASVLEENAPKEKGWRSLNAQSFTKFAQHPKVGRGVVFDPYAPHKGLQGVGAAFHGDADQRAASFSRILATMVAEGGPTMATGHKTTEITSKIRAYRLGALSREELIKYLTEDVHYKESQKSPHKHGTTGWYHWVENGGADYVPGSFDEVRLAYNTGLLDQQTYHAVQDALYNRAAS